MEGGSRGQTIRVSLLNGHCLPGFFQLPLVVLVANHNPARAEGSDGESCHLVGWLFGGDRDGSTAHAHPGLVAVVYTHNQPSLRVKTKSPFPLGAARVVLCDLSATEWDRFEQAPVLLHQA